MAPRSRITSSANRRLKQLRRVGGRRGRSDGTTFVVEGYRQLRHALEAGATVEAIYAAPELYLGTDEHLLVAQAERRGARIFELTAPAFASIATHGRPDGLVGVVARWPTRLGDVELGEEPLLLVAEAVERPGNLGTIVRTACAARVTALVLCDSQTNPFHPKAVSASVGSIFHLAVARATREETRHWLGGHGIRTVVAVPEGRCAMWEADLTGSLALVVGCEKRGVTTAWLDEADATVTIPIAGRGVDSLNVGVAAGIVLFEAIRQRGTA